MIDRVSLLKNSNTFGLEVDSVDILHYNLNKYYKEIEVGRSNSNIFANLGMLYGSSAMASNLICVTFNANGSKEFNVELPVSLNRSNFCASLITRRFSSKSNSNTRIGCSTYNLGVAIATKGSNTSHAEINVSICSLSVRTFN